MARESVIAAQIAANAQIEAARLAAQGNFQAAQAMNYRAALEDRRARELRKQELALEEKKLKQSAAKSDLDSIIESRKALDTNSRLSENNRIQGYGVLAKLKGDAKMGNTEAEVLARNLKDQKVVDQKTGKLRNLTPEEFEQKWFERKARREMDPYADALGRLLGVGQMQEAAGIPAKDVYGNELGAPVNQPSLAKGQNILNPNPPQDKSVPPQTQVRQTASMAVGGGAPAPQNVARPRQQAYMEGGLPTWLQQAGVPGSQAAEAEARFKQGGIQEVTNPTSTNYNSMVAKLAGIQSPKMTPEMEKRFQEYLAATTGGQYDSQQYIAAKKAFMMDQGNWQKGGKGSKPPWMLYGSKEWDDTGTSQALAEKDADWFRKMLPAEEYKKMANRIKKGGQYEGYAGEGGYDAAGQGWDMNPETWYDRPVSDTVPVDNPALLPQKKYSAFRGRKEDDPSYRMGAIRPWNPPQEESAVTNFFRGVVNPHYVFGSVPSGLGLGESDAASKVWEAQGDMGRAMMAPFNPERIWNAQGDMTRAAGRGLNLINSEVPQWSGPQYPPQPEPQPDPYSDSPILSAIYRFLNP